jgi:hypothetical protein
MTPLQKRSFVALAVLIALTRLLAISRSLFDWDEALFALALRDYDVVNHHPHPPGYPLFIAAAKLFQVAGVEAFRSLQIVVVLGAMLLFPALYLFARAVGFGFATAAGGAALFAFLPNVWVYGGTGFSDIPSTTIVLFACALLLRGDKRAYLFGAILLGIAAGMRLPCLLIGFIPSLIGTYRQLRARNFGAVIAAILLGASIVAASYLGAAQATGSVEAYVKAVRAQSDYVRDIDSWRNPKREPLHEVAEDFFLRPVQQQAQMYGIVLLGLISVITSIVRKRPAPLLTAAIFTPFAIAAWLNLDVYAAGRYSIPYLAAYTLCAADGLGILARHRVRVQTALIAAVILVFVVWTWPGLQLQRTAYPPPIAALRWVKTNVPPQTPVYISHGVAPQADYLVPERPTYWETPEQIAGIAGDAWVLDLKPVRDGHNFTWPRTNPLWKILRRRNFESSLARVSSFVRFGPEWYSEEGSGIDTFRWMPRTATATLPAIQGNGRLHVKLYVPIDTLPSPPQIEVMMNGAVVERFTGSESSMARTWTVPSRGDAPNELRITTSATVNPAQMGHSPDSRDLGLRLDALSWTPQN